MADASPASEVIVEVTTRKKKRRGCLGCLKWLFILFAIFLVISGIIAIFLFRVPQRLGLLPNAAKREFIATPDREGGAKLLAEVQARGMNTQGVTLYVMPYKDGGNAAIVLMDSREGFAFSRSEGLNPVASVFTQVAGGPTAVELGLKYVTAIYVSKKGEDLMTLSASRADALSFANGSMSEQEFMTKLNGDLNLPAIMGEQIDSINRMLSE